MTAPLYEREEGLKRGNGVLGIEFGGFTQDFPVIVRKDLHSKVEVAVEASRDRLDIPRRRADPGKVPFHHQVSVVFLRWVLPDGEIAEQGVEPVRLVEVVVVFQHGKQQALAEPARAEEEQLFAGRLQQRDVIRAVYVMIALRDEGIEVTDGVGKFHGSGFVRIRLLGYSCAGFPAAVRLVIGSNPFVG